MAVERVQARVRTQTELHMVFADCCCCCWCCLSSVFWRMIHKQQWRKKKPNEQIKFIDQFVLILVLFILFFFLIAAIGCMGTKILFVNYRFLYMRANSSNDHKYLVRFILFLLYISYMVAVLVLHCCSGGSFSNTYGRPKTAY